MSGKGPLFFDKGSGSLACFDPVLSRASLSDFLAQPIKKEKAGFLEIEF
jgi:hypothetical protein